MKVNGEAIYGSKTLAPYKENNICMTRGKNGENYFFYMTREGEQTMPSEIVIQSHKLAKGAKVTLLGSKQTLKTERLENGFKVIIPASLRQTPPCKWVWTLKVTAIE